MRMTISVVSLAVLLATGSASAETGRNVKKQPSKQAEIQRALSAVPSSLRAGAAVAQLDEHGKVTILRDGNNGWTCMPRDIGTPNEDPLCFDETGWAWMKAAMAGEAPDPSKVGYCYMLKGGSIWSNTDPAAAALPPGEKSYIKIPPHVMILNAKVAADSGLPSGAHPDTSKPFVMYAGTPYANVTIPVQ